LLQKASVCLIGPGLGEDDWAYALWQEVSKTLLPLVVDASALHFLAQAPCRKDHWILTPHPGEAASLLQKTSQDVQKDRIGAIRALHRTYGGTIVLKGVGSLVCTLESTISLCPFGNPAMASAGMGDILAGIIAGLLAQGLTIKEAALYGVLLHAKAGDAAFHEQGERGILASDLFPYIQKLVNGCTQR
jgi:NAD(P)H-hydrate epimerase